MSIINKTRQPILFLGHGSPMNAIETNDYTNCLKEYSKKLLEQKPKSILMISAHWMTQGTYITYMDNPKTIYDFFGFPRELYKIKYPAPSDKNLAQNIIDKLKKYDIKKDETQWGFDHGAWSVLVHLFPKADIPVVQLSLDMTKPASFHFELGQQLKFLRDENVLIIASGNIVHNLRRINFDTQAAPFDWCIEFDEAVKQHILNKNFEPLIQTLPQTPSGKLSVPTNDHYFPFLYILGAADTNDDVEFIFEGYQNASISMRCLKF